MKLLKNLSLFVLICAFASALHAQTNLTQTTLASAVTSASATNIIVASATGISNPSGVSGNVFASPTQTELFVDAEAMLVTSVNGTVVNVVRGASSTSASTHAANAVVWVAKPNQLYTLAPTGSCTAVNTVNPYINVLTGQQFFCDTGTGNWQNVFSTGAITPAATAAAIGTAAQTFTVAGLASGEPVTVVSQPAPTSLCPLVAARVTAANTVSLYFTTLTAAACTPASGTYFLLSSRLNIP
jgi:hypothetical protein